MAAFDSRVNSHIAWKATYEEERFALGTESLVGFLCSLYDWNKWAGLD